MIKTIQKRVLELWKEQTQKGLEDFIRIPAISRGFDPEWNTAGQLDCAIECAERWVHQLGLKSLKTQRYQDPGFPPCLFTEIEATPGCEDAKTIFFYGHLDKQPPNVGWDDNKSAWTPVEENGRLYGRGVADDGYSWYCMLTAVKALEDQGLPHPRCVALFETDEESGSLHYESYLEHWKDKCGDVGTVLVLDSCCGDYKRLWLTQSLRGMIGGTLRVEVLRHGVHSGEAGGIVPSSFMIIRSLLDRVEDSSTGRVKGEAYYSPIEPAIIQKTLDVVRILGDDIVRAFPWEGATQPLMPNAFENALNRSWRPALSVTGASGIPPVAQAGNVLRESTSLKVGMRLPPTVDADKAWEALEKTFGENPPFGASVSFTDRLSSSGWNCPQHAEWLSKTLQEASEALWGEAPAFLGFGASIPLLCVFDKVWPDANYIVAGVLGPESNAHGPNEFLHIDFAQKLTASLALVMTRSAGCTK
jgi:acetylornithine deacetylase/succinyl-diaminopimelate desuccinylase-like protein